MTTLKDANQIVEKLGVDNSKIPLDKKVFKEIVEKAKNLAFDRLINKKD